MSIPDILPLSPPSTSSRRKIALPNSSVHITSTPDSAASFPGSSHTESRKRVGFSTSANVHKSLSSSQPPSSGNRPLCPSSDTRSVLKSILKPAPVGENPIPTTDGSEDVKRSMSEMMESIVQELAQDDRSISVDAYSTLASVIQAYDDIPEEDVLKAKINTIMKHIKRDLLRKPIPDEPPIADTNLMTQALRVLLIFVWNRDYASLLSDEYRIFVLDRSIQVLTEHTAPKSVIIHHLHLLAAQNFRSSLITSHRVTRLLEVLKTLTENYKGNGVISERLLVYQKLLDQARSTMKAKVNLWVEELLTAMTNPLRDIRTKAIALGSKSCAAFPPSSSISTIVKSTLAQELGPGKSFSSVMCRKLEKMITVKEEGVQVPQIWTIVLMLSNSANDRDKTGSGPRFDKWPQFKDWLTVIQNCFNCSESAIKQQSYKAWNRFVHIVQPHQTSDSLLELLAKPLTAQIDRHTVEPTGKGTRPTAVSSYCTLLYYAFRPAATHDQYTRIWNEYIMKLMKTSFFEKSTANADITSRIFMALFWNSNRSTKIWNENRALENTLVEPEELPTIDCKWTRSKSRAILDVFRVLMRYSSWGASGQSEKAYIAMAWVHFLKALREASSKEIKTSTETMEAIIHLTSFLGRSYENLHKHTSGERQPRTPHALSIAQVRQLTVSTVAELGQDLVLAGLADKGRGLSKVLVLYDALNACTLELKENALVADDSTSMNGTNTSICNLEACLKALDAAMVQDFKSEKITGTTVGLQQLQERLECSSLEATIDTLTLLMRPTVLLLKEDISEWQDKDQHDPSRPYPDIIAFTLTILSNLPVTSLYKLDETFAALLNSTHELVVKDAVEMWNQQFGELQSLAFGPVLLKALTKLQESGVEIRVPGSPTPAIEPTEHGPLANAPSEKAPTPAPSRYTSPSPDEAMSGAGPSPELGSQYFRGAALGGNASLESPQRPVSRLRLRHDDSQIQFAPIESPLPQDEPESQLLTAHQKEVRDRQRSEPAVVFADLRSSPRPRSRSLTHTDCEFARKAAAQVDRPTTPTLPTSYDQGEPEIMASPTPRARHTANQITDIEVPSSPPSMAGNNDKQELTSSPPQAVRPDARDRINLTMVQPDVGPDQGTMKMDGFATDGSAAQRPTSVEQEALKVQADIYMDGLDADEPIEDPGNFQNQKLPPSTMVEPANTSNDLRRQKSRSKKYATEGNRVAAIGPSKKLNHERLRTSLQKSRRLEQLAQDDTVVALDAQREDTAVGTADSCNGEQANKDLDQNLHHNPQNSDDDQNLPRPPPTFSQQLRPIIINLPPDSTTADLEIENAERSPVTRGRTDSDEIDMLSASQLSHDLDQHVSQTAGFEEDGTLVRATAESQSEQQEGHQEVRHKSQRSRKRKSAPQKFTSIKRTRLRPSSQTSSFPSEADSSVHDTHEEMLDCIEVSPSQAVQAITPVGLAHQVQPVASQPAAPTKRRPGRPRKRPRNGRSNTHSQDVRQAGVEVVVPETSHVKEEAIEDVGVVGSPLLEHGNSGEGGQGLDQEVEIQEALTTVVTGSAEAIVTDDVAGAAANEGSSSPDIMASLQAVLDRLKSSKPRNVDLRTLDDLCFQIRFQAQIIAQQQDC